MNYGINNEKLTIILVSFHSNHIIENLINSIENNNLHLSISSQKSGNIVLEEVIETLESHCTKINLRRFDSSDESFEATFLVEYDNYKNMIDSKNAIQNLSNGVRFTFLDTSDNS